MRLNIEIESHFSQAGQHLGQGSIMTQDRKVAEAKLQQLRKAQQDFAQAQQEVIISQIKLDGHPDDKTDSQPGFADHDD